MLFLAGIRFILHKKIRIGVLEMAERHGALRTITQNPDYTGITADIVLPETVDVTSGYVDWYMGIGDAHIEAGISRTKDGYKVFCGTGSQYGDQHWNSEYDNRIQDGDRVNVKLVHNYIERQLEMYVNGELYYDQPIADEMYSVKGLHKFDTVKTIIGVQDNGTSSHSQSSFSQVQLRANAAGSIYHDFDSSVPYNFGRVDISGNGGGDDYTVYSALPLSGALNAK